MTRFQPHGLLPVYKPPGLVSKDVSRQLERTFGRLKLGHVGTLDPMAEGVLPLLLGAATRLQDHLLASRKCYRVEMTFGYETDTLDAEGNILRELPIPQYTREQIEAEIAGFLGAQTQSPPIYSAIKYKGRPLYDYARKGEMDKVPLAELKRSIQVYSFSFQSWDGQRLIAELEVSKGTYIRSVVRDLAEKLGCCATMTRLIRNQAAGLFAEQCHPLHTILELSPDNFRQAVIPIEDMALPMPSCRLGGATVTRLQTGQKVWLGEAAFGESLRESGENWHCGPGSSPILLTDPSGRAFGLGLAQRSDHGKIWLNMKRGFR